MLSLEYFTSIPTHYYLKGESYASQAVASIEELCTHMLLSCAMIKVQPLEKV